MSIDKVDAAIERSIDILETLVKVKGPVHAARVDVFVNTVNMMHAMGAPVDITGGMLATLITSWGLDVRNRSHKVMFDEIVQDARTLAVHTRF